jgi:uncharacterized protein (DUF2249 family)/hemerythrin-like domain-containing protein
MTEANRELDARTLSPPEIFHAFDALAPGEGFVLLHDHEQRPLLDQFQDERSGAFEWSVLEAGPARFRVEIRRRAGSGPRGVREFLGDDHRRLDAILREAARLAYAGSFTSASEIFSRFRCGLERHIEMEEQILFPVFEQVTGMTGGPTVVMHHEHLEIRRLLEVMDKSLRAEDFAGVLEAVREFAAVIESHNEKEEAILYPTVDRSLGGDRERDDLVRRMQRL